jgi:hypothetical protein
LINVLSLRFTADFTGVVVVVVGGEEVVGELSEGGTMFAIVISK